MRCLILFIFMLILMKWKVSGESAEHENLQSVLEEFKNRMFEEIREEIARALAAFSEKLKHSYGMTKTATVQLNDTSELEARVEVLEVEMANVQGDVVNIEDDVNNVEIQVNNVESQLINVQEDITDNEDQIFALVLDVDNLNEVTFVHQEQISGLQADVSNLQNTDEKLDARITNLENNESGSSNTTDLEIRVSALEVTVSEHIIAISNLQETDISLEERIQELEQSIGGEWTACESSPCDNGGTCVDVNVDTFICVCRDGFFGTTCSESYADATFLASFTADIVSPVPDPIVFDLAIVNAGNHYDPTTGIYTVPLNGTYEITIQLKNDIIADNDWGYNLAIDGDDVTFNRHDASGSSDSEFVTLSSTIIFPLRVGYQISVTPLGIDALDGAGGGEIRSWFFAHLIHAE